MDNYDSFMLNVKRSAETYFREKEKKMSWKNLELYAPENYEHSLKIAEAIWKSSCAQKPWLKSPEAVLFVMQKGVDLEISPLLALEQIFAISRSSKDRDGNWINQSTWGININLAKALIARAGGKYTITSETDNGITITMEREGWKTHTETVSLADLELIVDKQGKMTDRPAFKSYPKQIFRAVAFRRAAMFMFADKLLGVIPVDAEVEERDITEPEQTITQENITEKDNKPRKTRKKPEVSSSPEKEASEQATAVVCNPPENQTIAAVPSEVSPPLDFDIETNRPAGEPFTLDKHRELMMQAVRVVLQDKSFSSEHLVHLRKFFPLWATENNLSVVDVNSILEGFKKCVSQPVK